MSNVEHLELCGIIGINGKLSKGLHFHPDKVHLLYSTGNMVVIKNMVKHSYRFLTGHSNMITCLTLSISGKYVAAGQLSHLAFKTDLFVWEFESGKQVAEHALHRGKVQGIAISPNDLFVASIGGLDDGNVVVYCLTKKEPLLAALTTTGIPALPTLICYANKNDLTFVTTGRDTVRVWLLIPNNRQVIPFNTQLGHVRRDICCVIFDADDRFIYCGTKTGDILKIRVNVAPSSTDSSISDYTPILVCNICRKTPNRTVVDCGAVECLAGDRYYSQGVTAMCLMKNGNFMIGTGNGKLCRTVEEVVRERQRPTLGKPFTKELEKPVATLNELSSVDLQNGIMSVTIRGDGHQVYACTKSAEIFCVNLLDLSYDLLCTSHTEAVRGIIFPPNCDDLFASCGENIRIWNTKTGIELVRINIPNMICTGMVFTTDGQSIISGWNDGKIRAFTPETGKLIFIIHDAHMRGVTAVTVSTDCKQVMSGGGEGSVRVWDIMCKIQKLRATMHEHRGSITAMVLRKDNLECVSCSIDGYCIIWDMRRYIRAHVIFASTMFMGLCYHPSESQLLTCGTNRKISYWECLDAQLIREVEGSKSGTINSIDTDKDGISFVSGGADKLIKLWKYNEGDVTHTSLVHSGDVNCVKIGPQKKFIISGCEDGTIFVWKYPVNKANKEK